MQNQKPLMQQHYKMENHEFKKVCIENRVIISMT